MDLNLPPRFIVFDTEYTTWEGAQARNWSGPGEYKEIVQIAAARVDGKNLVMTDTFVRFVKPVKNPTLSEYFINLTAITQAQIDTNGISYQQALGEFSTWAGGQPCFCYGTDNLVMTANATLIAIEFPFPPTQFHNIKDIFKAHGIPADNYMSSTIVEAFGQQPARRGHDALNDVKTVIDALKLLPAKI